MKSLITNFIEAKIITNMLCDCKVKSVEYSISSKKYISQFYSDLKKIHHEITNKYTLKDFAEIVSSLKQYIEENEKHSLREQLSNNNIHLINYNNEVKDCYKYINSLKDLEVIEIEDVENVICDEGKYFYINDVGVYELNPKGMIVRQTDPLKNNVDNVIIYINETNDNLKKRTGASRPVCGWYAMSKGANYYYSSAITVGRWYNLPKNRKEYALTIE